MNFKFREYYPRIGRFLSVDPLAHNYPWNSTYAFAENDVIRSIDLVGLEKYIHIFAINGPAGDPNSTQLRLLSNTKLQKSGPMGDRHLYIYHNMASGSIEEYYKDEIWNPPF